MMERDTRKLMRNVGLAVGMLMAQLPLHAVQRGNAHSFAVWGTAGYSSLANHAAQPYGGAGWSVGGGYVYDARSGFILQGGLELSRHASRMGVDDVLQIKDMFNTQGEPYDGYFYFRDIRERHTAYNIAPVLQLGMKGQGGAFFLAGGKMLLNVGGNAHTTWELTTKAHYDYIIGDDNDGMLGNMPNHGLETKRYAEKYPLNLNVCWMGTLECGYSFPLDKGKKNHPELRLSAFVDFGVSAINKRKQTDVLISNTADTGEYKPRVGPVLLYNVQARFLQSLYSGVKLTYTMQVKQVYKCNCEWW